MIIRPSVVRFFTRPCLTLPSSLAVSLADTIAVNAVADVSVRLRHEADNVSLSGLTNRVLGPPISKYAAASQETTVVYTSEKSRKQSKALEIPVTIVTMVVDRDLCCLLISYLRHQCNAAVHVFYPKKQ
jgi:hypothetical protein